MARFSGFEERLNHLEVLKKGIALLEEQERELQKSLSKLRKSYKSLGGSLNILAKKIDELQTRMLHVSTKN